MKQINKEIAREMLDRLSDQKKKVLDAALRRNAILTSDYGLENATLNVYKEGFYLVLEGCRSRFAVWYADNDGELIEGRKPQENKLHKLYSEWTKTDMIKAIL